jgi:YD repeat-containing protein
MGCPWGVALLLAGLSACGSSSTKCAPNCKADASVGDAKGADRANESDGAGDARANGAPDGKDPNDAKERVDGAVACDLPLAAACAVTPDAGAFTFQCTATWSATTSNAYFCGRPQTTVLSYTCGTAHELIDTNNAGTAEYIYVFDGDGKLTAISYSTGGTSHCIAGPEAFVPPLDCGTASLFSCHADGAAH